MIIGIGVADYSRRYRLQPILLIIGPITSITDVSVQLYVTPNYTLLYIALHFSVMSVKI